MRALRVLVIDDELIVLESVKAVLGHEGMETDLAQASRDGLAWGLEREYDLVLTDIRMPEIGGMRILRDLKRARPSLPVVIFTGYATVQSAVQAMKLGAADYIEKPFTPEMLVTTVHKALEKAKVETPERQEVVNREEVIRVLERAAVDSSFVASLFSYGADALQEYQLTGAEKLAILTGDIQWLEGQLGPLSAAQKRWLEGRLSAEIW